MSRQTRFNAGVCEGAEVEQSPAPEPIAELGGDGPEEAVTAALEALDAPAGRDRNSGRFTAGNRAAFRHGGRSGRLVLALADGKRNLAAKLSADLGLDDSSATTLRGVADLYAEVTLLRRSLFAKIAAEGGPVTAKGRSKAALAAYLSLADREARLAAQLGLARRARPVGSLADALAAVEIEPLDASVTGRE